MDRARMVVAVMSLAALVVVFVFAMGSDRTSKPMPPNGDVLGMESGETLEEYQARAEESLAIAAADPSAAPAFSLITFTEPIPARDVERITAQLPRVNAVISEHSQLVVPLPEPTGAETRADVIRRAVGQERISAALAYAGGVELVAASESPQVLAVEVLPSDAAWGRFGVRPVAAR
ncbi:hypothetical protein [Corynebacterium kozikiae]|uniref:hypothetical protein n=1 Tax=Corynebacterium kozikiae TaxID=2968469 RepID=UPI00211C9CB0|nr:hypothetical protein [Corynebacterium sp. 76QC2CO]MCQ9342302.1 hypothetical protein [Corynebacterium sp. 76QC2CO]